MELRRGYQARRDDPTTPWETGLPSLGRTESRGPLCVRHNPARRKIPRSIEEEPKRVGGESSRGLRAVELRTPTCDFLARRGVVDPSICSPGTPGKNLSSTRTSYSTPNTLAAVPPITIDRSSALSPAQSVNCPSIHCRDCRYVQKRFWKGMSVPHMRLPGPMRSSISLQRRPHLAVGILKNIAEPHGEAHLDAHVRGWRTAPISRPAARWPCCSSLRNVRHGKPCVRLHTASGYRSIQRMSVRCSSR